jgi:glyoxylase-like metal-dependent hydrolase (beta-lactamase superfamily II)
MESAMQILMNTGGIANTNCFLIADESSRQSVLFDAPDNTVGPLLDQATQRGWELIGLWLTHGHFDHLADHAVVTSRFPKAQLLIHRLDEPKLIDPGSRFFALPFEIPARQADGYLIGGQVLRIGSLEAKVIETPGHSPGHVMFYFEKEKTLVGGDLIICGGVGRTDLPDSDPAQLIASIRKVMALPADTRLLPGHCDVTTLGDEGRSNPYVREAMGK